MESETSLARKDILHFGRLGIFSPSAAKYTSSIDIDGRLLSAVIAINSAHALMLSEKGIIPESVASQLLNALVKVPANLEMKDALEDVHMNVEDYVISKTGKEVGGMLNLGKSRNDQVATALRIALRDRLILLGGSMIALEKSLLAQASKNTDAVMPGYTHLQRAQPITVGHHLLAHWDSLDRDFSRLVDCYLRINQCPMGAGALASTGFAIDRERVSELLGFDSLIENSLDAVSSRDFATEAIYVCTQTMADLSRLAEEIIIWTSKEFSFAEISDKHASTSSMMPQKKNAIVPEIFRAKTGQVLGEFVGAMSLLKALPLSYNLDLQELTRNLWSALDKSIESVQILSEVVAEIRFNKEILLEATESDDFMYATELADHLVSKDGIPFREAHSRVASLVRYCSNELKLKTKQFRSLDSETLSRVLRVKITQEEISKIVSPDHVLGKRKALGSPSPKLVKKAVEKRLEILARHENTMRSFESKIVDAQKLLLEGLSSARRKHSTMEKHAREVKV